MMRRSRCRRRLATRRASSNPGHLFPKKSLAQAYRKLTLIRGQKVMLDSDLAEMYGVETGGLVRAVKRNVNRFRLISCFNSLIRSSTT